MTIGLSINGCSRCKNQFDKRKQVQAAATLKAYIYMYTVWLHCIMKNKFLNLGQVVVRLLQWAQLWPLVYLLTDACGLKTSLTRGNKFKLQQV